jgi:hypothetical protein
VRRIARARDAPALAQERISMNLTIGDVFDLKPGHKVYVRMEERFVYFNRPGSRQIAQATVQVGEKWAEFTDPRVVVFSDNPPEVLDTGALVGRYVVTQTALDGGGQATDGAYPNGWHVTAKKLAPDGTWDPQGMEVNFYQSGCFTAMIENVSPVGRMEMSFQERP